MSNCGICYVLDIISLVTHMHSHSELMIQFNIFSHGKLNNGNREIGFCFNLLIWVIFIDFWFMSGHLRIWICKCWKTNWEGFVMWMILNSLFCSYNWKSEIHKIIGFNLVQIPKQTQKNSFCPENLFLLVIHITNWLKIAKDYWTTNLIKSL